MKTLTESTMHSTSKGRFSSLKYKNGETVLPPELLEEIQKYIQGELVYIPKANQKRAGWGEANGTRMMIRKRNEEIFSRYKNGSSIAALACVFHLSEDSIKKIVLKLGKQSVPVEETTIGMEVLL